MYKKRLKTPTFYFPVLLVVGDKKELDKFIDKKNIELCDTTFPVARMQPGENAKVIEWEEETVVVFLKWPDKSVVVHESVHLAVSSLKYAGVKKIGSHNEEILAYLTEGFFDLIDKKLSKWYRKSKANDEE